MCGNQSLPWEKKLSDPAFVFDQKNKFITNIEGSIKKMCTGQQFPSILIIIAAYPYSFVVDFLRRDLTSISSSKYCIHVMVAARTSGSGEKEVHVRYGGSGKGIHATYVTGAKEIHFT